MSFVLACPLHQHSTGDWSGATGDQNSLASYSGNSQVEVWFWLFISHAAYAIGWSGQSVGDSVSSDGLPTQAQLLQHVVRELAFKVKHHVWSSLSPQEGEVIGSCF